ncbi:hypothetical protein J3Q64DRAFT_1755039 [Phycomyces blakesleeanus]|uniref:Uncharacterized protein n=2 Tax=Phycomyces blakesleeanus TaxID=4837 RepID=A0A167JWP5_PHYB8|nr:hypothetical protein PHYBLDRAFT_70187 [Phycomyces blakesleeanus NRRL 1555(-)]OAD66820.1 hypothetical protein PHYBLDRAFT_70187 [Phycomyces blakesleeanus NRRL 1555(-)]|eukprot:XP_018284860.1 hypothetical protein PHYBLDRAFT_70187 [Phycomyces blakesleeanus NRRL 1555(-)]
MTAVQESSSYKGYFKPKFWQRSKVDIEPTTTSQDTIESPITPKDIKPLQKQSQPQEEEVEEQQEQLKPKQQRLFRSPFSRKAVDPTLSVQHTAPTEVYELSMVSDTGVYIPPIEEKIRDHWVDISQPAEFDLPSPECLTTALGGPHEFFTPSAVAMRSSSISSLSLNEDNSDDDGGVPSLISNSSRRSSSESFH